jgi:DNA-directed RNA polymerase specialized sigma24 family protein
METWRRLEKEDTATLIDCYQNDGNNENLRRDAFLVLCFRFREDLIKKCEVICKNRGHDIDIAIQIAENTFLKFGKTARFSNEKGTQSTIDDNFRIYLYSIASNQLKDYYRHNKKKEQGLLYDGNEGIITEFPLPANPSHEQQVIRDALLSLSHKHQVVYLTYLVHERPGVNLPKPLQAKLRAYLGGVEQATVRSYKKEAADKINAAKAIIQTLKRESHE